jgi:hypothetical protein
VSFTYDVTQPSGKVRLLCTDIDTANAIFQDAEIQAFMDLNSQDVRLAAAQALDVIAASDVYIEKKLLLPDLIQTDGPAVAEALHAQAKELRRQVMEGDADGLGLFDIAEEVVDPFSLRARLLNELLRKTGS